MVLTKVTSRHEGDHFIIINALLVACLMADIPGNNFDVMHSLLIDVPRAHIVSQLT